MGTTETLRSRGRSIAVLALALAACALALTLSPGARAGLLDLDLGDSPIVLGPITVLDGVATVTGTIGGEPDVTANLTVNGQPVGIGAQGEFTAEIDLGGESLIELVLATPASGEQTVLRIPLTLLGPGGTIPPNVLDPLRLADIQLTLPPDGLVSLDAGGLSIEGKVLHPEALLSLTINGQQVEPGPGGGFTVTVPPGTREVVVVATGSNGVSQTTTFPVAQLSSVISTSQGTSVSAAGADGVVISRIVYRPNAKTQRVRMVVTIKDRRGFLVRDAVVRVRGIPARMIVAGSTATTTNRVGRATLVLRPRASAFGKRLKTRTVARVPSATASKITAVRLPRLAR